MNEDNEQNVEQDNGQNQTENNKPVKQPPGLRKLFNKGKKARKRCYEKSCKCL